MLNFRKKKASSLYLAISIHFYSMLLDSKLLASSNTSRGSDKNKPPIYEEEMDEKRTSLLKEEELEEEKFGGGEDEETIKESKEMIDKHNERIKEEKGWDPEGNDNLPTVNRREVRNPTFLDDDSVKGSIDERKDRGVLGELVVKNRSKESLDTTSSEETIKGRSNDDSAYDIPDIDFDDF